MVVMKHTYQLYLKNNVCRVYLELYFRIYATVYLLKYENTKNWSGNGDKSIKYKYY